MEPFETFTHAGCTIELHYDTDAGPPNQSMDMAGTFGHWHRNYIVGDEDLRRGEHSAAFERSQRTRFGLAYLIRYLELVEHAVAVVPVGMIDHSGVTVYAGGGAHACDPGGWDSGTVGLYWITRDEAQREGWDEAGAERYIRGEITTWAAYLEGRVCGYIVRDENGDEIDSCWGFYPDESTPEDVHGLEHVREEARSFADWHRKQRDEAARVEEIERTRCANLDIATREGVMA